MATRGLPAWPYAGAEADALPRAERLLLDLARLHAEAARRGAPARPALRLPCIAEGAAAALSPAEAVLRALDMPAACPLCPRVAPAEARYLLAVAMAQHGQPRLGQALLQPAAPPQAALHALAQALSRAGLALAAPPWPRRRR